METANTDTKITQDAEAVLKWLVKGCATYRAELNEKTQVSPETVSP